MRCVECYREGKVEPAEAQFIYQGQSLCWEHCYQNLKKMELELGIEDTDALNLRSKAH